MDAAVAGPGGDGRHRTQVRLSADPSSLHVSRELVREALTGWGFSDPGRLELTELIVTELAANVVRHVGGHFELCVSADRGTVTLAVHDESPAMPVRRRAEDGDQGGRGMMIVESVAAAWGVEQIPDDGKQVWARLRWPAQPARPSSSRKPQADC
jgi:anti-sigma regulatory factor (Ser/Thr protein kinase)